MVVVVGPVKISLSGDKSFGAVWWKKDVYQAKLDYSTMFNAMSYIWWCRSREETCRYIDGAGILEGERVKTKLSQVIDSIEPIIVATVVVGWYCQGGWNIKALACQWSGGGLMLGLLLCVQLF